MRSRSSPTNEGGRSSPDMDPDPSGKGHGTKAQGGWVRFLLVTIVLVETVVLLQMGYGYRYAVEKNFEQVQKDVLVAQELAEELQLKLGAVSSGPQKQEGDRSYQQEVLDLCEQRLSRALTEEKATQNELKQCQVEAVKADSSAKSPFSSPVWLAIGIPTVAREVDGETVDYLSATLDALNRNLPVSDADPLWGRVRVVVVDNSHVDHTVFEENRKRFENDQHFVFIQNTAVKGAERPVSLDASSDKPGKRVQQQTNDVVFTLKEVERLTKPQFYAFMEDDFELCANGLLAIQYAMNKATMYHGDWIALRMSYGLNGIVIRGKDVLPVSRYFEGNVRRRPPDHLIVEWFAGETAFSKKYKNNRVNIGFRYNIFKHIGVRSTIRKAKFKHRNFPRCWEELVYPVVFEVEGFNPQQCPDDDIWPCKFTVTKEDCPYENCAALNQRAGLPSRLPLNLDPAEDYTW